MSDHSLENTPEPLPFHEEESEGSIPQRFAKVVSHCPDWPAIKDGDTRLTYRELDLASNQVANAILDERGVGEEPIALLLEHGVGVVVAVLGVLKSGKCYVALTPENPTAHLETILEDMEAPLIITEDRHSALAVELAQDRRALLNLDELEGRFSDEPVDVPISADSLAIIFFTSGSTGKPKGVPRTHRHVVHYAWDDARVYDLVPQDRHSLISLAAFAGFASDSYHTLLSGGTLYPFDARKRGLGDMTQWLAEEEITLFHPPVSLFGKFLESLGDEQSFPTVRLIVLGGQAVHKRNVDLFQEHFSGNCAMVSRLVSTECGVLSSIQVDTKSEFGDSTMPAGYPARGKEILILDDDGEPMEPGSKGEIAVRSRYLAPGYWRRPELTSQVFLPDPKGGDKRIFLTGDLGRIRQDGCLEILGRKDFQVKVRGFRIELEAVEAALRDLESVKEAAVIAQPTLEGDNRLIAYLVPAIQPPPTADALRSTLGEELPHYMIPSTFVVLAKMPRTPTGKIDRRSLPAPGHARPALASDYVAPDTERKKVLAEIWSQVLEVDQVGVQDSFFDLGGNSLLAMRLFTQVEEKFGTSCSMTSFLATPTIEQLDSIIQRESAAPDLAAGVVDTGVDTQDDKGSGWKRFTRKVLQVLALYAPMSFRTWLHRTRGVKLGEGVWIGAGVIIEGAYPQLVSIGDNVAMSVRCTIIAHFRTPPAQALASNQPLVRIEDDAYLGPGTIVLPNVTIGQGAVVSAGSVVSQSIPPMTMVQGNPARPVARCGVPLRGHSYEEFLRKLEPIED